MNNYLLVTFGAISLCFLLVMLVIFGRWIGLKAIQKDPHAAKCGVSQVEGVVLTLLRLMLAFTFFGASQRFDERRNMIVKEANAIGTAWLRIDLLPHDQQSEVRNLFRQYLDARIKTTEVLPDYIASLKEIKKADELQPKIWNDAINALSKSKNPVVEVSVIQSFNEMFDVVNAHNTALFTHPPLFVYLTLVLLLGFSCFLLGYSFADAKKTNWVHGGCYIVVMVFVLYMIVDFEFPRFGLMKIDKYDQPMHELKDTMNTFKNQ